MASHCNGNHCFPHHLVFTVKRSVSLKNILDKTVEITHFVKSWPLNAYLSFKSLFQNREYAQSSSARPSMVVVSRRSRHVIELWAKLVIVLNTIFTWKNNWWLLRLGYLAVSKTNSQKLTKWACHFKENNGPDLLPIVKFELSWEKKLWKLVFSTMSLTTSQYLQMPLIWSVVVLTNFIFNIVCVTLF